MAPLTVTDYGNVASHKAALRVPEGGDPFLRRSTYLGAPLIAVFDYVNDTGAPLAANSIIEFGQLPPCRVIGFRLEGSAMGAGRELNVGVQEYHEHRSREPIASDIDALAQAVDVSAASDNLNTDLVSLANFASQPGGFYIYGNADILGQILNDTLPVDGALRLTIEILPFNA